MFKSYAQLAGSLLADLSGLCLLGANLKAARPVTHRQVGIRRHLVALARLGR